jgi:2',3'-cyclic-nucleotide 2'-phosphodiesterase (5'-nucleotidase family)
MKIHTLFAPVILLWLLAGTSCNTTYQSQSLQYKSYRINDAATKDSAVNQFLEPYRSNVNKTMNSVVGIVDESMDKAQPESRLGNFMADAMYTMAAEKYNTPVDAAFINFGGIRLTQLPKGEVTTGKVFELMPFDNILIIQKIRGDVLQQFLNLTAGKGGWPCAGITMQLKDKKAINVMVGGKPLDPARPIPSSIRILLPMVVIMQICCVPYHRYPMAT